MTISAWLSKSIKKLESTSVPTARLDAEVLLADELDKDRSWINTHPEYRLQGLSLQKLDEQIERRMTHEPLAYIRGKQEFYGRDFIVSSDTLTPRPETESMIELLLKSVDKLQIMDGEHLQIVDVGTGSGCIVITAALELAQISDNRYQMSFTGLDVSKPALKIAHNNAVALGADIKFQHYDLLKDDLSSILNPKYSVCILANLPYVPEDFHINLAASHEPASAIFGGKDGLDYYRVLFKKLSKLNIDFGKLIVLTEALPPHHSKLVNIANDAGFRLKVSLDFIQLFYS